MARYVYISPYMQIHKLFKVFFDLLTYADESGVTILSSTGWTRNDPYNQSF